MAVRPETLDHQERGLELATREPRDPAEPEGGPEIGADVCSAGAAAELQDLRGRIEAARITEPRDPAPHCGDCFRRGWKAALRAIEE